MNIKRAKEEIEHTVKAYLAKDALGEYAIPAIRQRPILLMALRALAKTQVMEQVAWECGWHWWLTPSPTTPARAPWVCPLSGSATTAIRTTSVTEYTMSEIIASIYAKMEATGLSEGILFIDEINCVSETLAPHHAAIFCSARPLAIRLCLRAGSSWRQATRRSTTNPSGILTS